MKRIFRRIFDFFKKERQCIICLEEDNLEKSPCCNSFMHPNCKRKFILSQTEKQIMGIVYKNNTRFYQIIQCPCCRLDRLFNLTKLEEFIMDREPDTKLQLNKIVNCDEDCDGVWEQLSPLEISDFFKINSGIFRI